MRFSLWFVPSNLPHHSPPPTSSVLSCHVSPCRSWSVPQCPLQVKARLEKMGRLQPMNIFLQQEIDRMQRVISTVRSTLHDLKLGIDGTIIMSETLRDALDSMYDARIPSSWQKVKNHEVLIAIYKHLIKMTRNSLKVLCMFGLRH